jgi:putative NIF3 family GTP cyclohydrolase 1 type 2
MRAIEIQDYLQALAGDWPYPADTVDTFKAGNPQAEVRGIAVGWMSYSWALRRAVELDCNLFVTHEPTYFDHFDRDPEVFRLPGARAKQRFIADQRLIVLRCHDLWDQMKRTGIADSWGQALGLGDAVAGDAYNRVYEIEPATARQVAARVAAAVRACGQPAVQLIGPADKTVRRVAIGTGAITPFFKYLDDYHANLAICTDDGIEYWRDGALAIDLDVPLVVVNHPVSEEAGVQRLAETLRGRFPQTPVHQIPQECMYQLIFPE